MFNPGRGGCLAGPIQQISSLAADTGINYSIIGPFSIWSFQLQFLCCLTQGEGGGCRPMQRNYCITTSILVVIKLWALTFLKNTRSTRGARAGAPERGSF